MCGLSSNEFRPIGGLFLFVFRKWSKYPNSAPKRMASKPCIKMDSPESWHFTQLPTQAFGNMTLSADYCPPFPASDQFWKRNSAHKQGILTTTPKTHEAISVIRKNLFIVHAETLIFIHLRENEGRRATMTPRSGTRKVGRNALRRPRQPTSLNGRAHRVPRVHRAPNQDMKKAPLLGLSQSVVRAKGLEPSRGCPHMDLNHTRLPIPPRPRDFQ